MKNKHNISEDYIITKYLKKLSFNKDETFNFKNDAAYFKIPKDKKLIVTNDTILETIDFFKNDPPESIANKIITCNLSDISSMGAIPYAYTLSLCLPKNINRNWLKEFANKLFYLQKKYNFFLMGGDLSRSKKIIISSNFFGIVNKNKILTRDGSKINDNIWVTGNLGDSSIGLKIIKNKIKINKKDKNYYLKKYYYPKHFLFGQKLVNYASSAIDISDGFYGDLNKLISSHNLGANIDSKLIPYSNRTKMLIQKKLIKINFLLSSGDDYQLIFTAADKNSLKIKKLAKLNNVKITKVGTITQKKGIYLDNKKINLINKSFQHFC
tara:strand:+ start:1209 stop:2183 length:975 start_codon:yes stop_codon:yes gene_type:complete